MVNVLVRLEKSILAWHYFRFYKFTNSIRAYAFGLELKIDW